MKDRLIVITFFFRTFSLINWLCCFLLTWNLPAGKTPYIFVFHFFFLCLGSSASHSGWTRDVDELDFVSGGPKEVFPFIGGNFSCNFLNLNHWAREQPSNNSKTSLYIYTHTICFLILFSWIYIFSEKKIYFFIIYFVILFVDFF